MNDTQARDDGEEKEDSEALVELRGHFEREIMTHEADESPSAPVATGEAGGHCRDLGVSVGDT